MAASTAGQLVLAGGKGGTRIEVFTMTPADPEYVTFASTGTTTLKTQKGGESIIGINVNNDGVTTVDRIKIYVDGQDIRTQLLLALYATDNAPVPTTLPNPIHISSNKEISLEVST